jgi:hypothetical protein
VADSAGCSSRRTFCRCGPGTGLDGFWIDRVLQNEGIESHVVDPASVATSRRRRRAKTDSIDGEALIRTLLSYKRGELRDGGPILRPGVKAMVAVGSPPPRRCRSACRFMVGSLGIYRFASERSAPLRSASDRSAPRKSAIDKLRDQTPPNRHCTGVCHTRRLGHGDTGLCRLGPRGSGRGLVSTLQPRDKVLRQGLFVALRPASQ